MNLEENKMLCETIINILFGIEFEKLPSVNVLRCIEDNIGVNLEFKHHFRFLVPQVNGWETMESWMETKGWLKWKNADKDKTCRGEYQADSFFYHQRPFSFWSRVVRFF